MKLKVNPEFFKRHLFVTVLMAGLGCWFGYDGLIGYPSMTGEALYRKIEGENAVIAEGKDLEAFKRQKIQTQYGFAALALLASLAVGLHLMKVVRFDFAFDDDGFVCGGKHHAWSDVKDIDRKAWEKKGIMKVDGIVLDAWHHQGVKEFNEKILSVRG